MKQAYTDMVRTSFNSNALRKRIHRDDGLTNFKDVLMKTVKEQALDSISSLSSDATWNDIAYCLYVRKKIEEAINAADNGRIVSHDEVKKLFAR